MKRLRFFAGIHDAIYQKCDTKDKKLINMLALMIPISALIAGGAFYTFVKFFSDSVFLAFFIGSIMFLMFLWHDQSLMSTDKLGQIYGRIIASLFLAVFILIPFKASQMQEVLINKITQETEIENADINLKMLEELQAIDEESKSINAKVTEAAKLWPEQKQPLIDARREKEEFDATKDQNIQDIRNTYSAMMKKPEVSKVAILGHYANNMFSSEAPSELFINLALIVFLLFVEASPAIVRLIIEKGEYLEQRDHFDALKKMADDKIRGLEIQIMQNDENITKHVFEVEITKEKRKQIENHFEDPQKLVQLARMAQMINLDDINRTTQQEESLEVEEEEEVPEFPVS